MRDICTEQSEFTSGSHTSVWEDCEREWMAHKFSFERYLKIVDEIFQDERLNEHRKLLGCNSVWLKQNFPEQIARNTISP